MTRDEAIQLAYASPDFLTELRKHGYTVMPLEATHDMKLAAWVEEIDIDEADEEMRPWDFRGNDRTHHIYQSMVEVAENDGFLTERLEKMAAKQKAARRAVQTGAKSGALRANCGW